MILGLDISTSIIGVCVYDDRKEEIIKTDYIDLRKIGNFLHKAQAVEEYINKHSRFPKNRLHIYRRSSDVL